MVASYIGLIRKEKKSDYGVGFPDFPGCITAGKTLEEAREWAKEALDLHIWGMLEDGESIPEPSSLDKIMSDPENQDAVAFLVQVALARPKAKRINVTISETVLEEIDEYVRAHPGENRSQVLARGAQRLIGNSGGGEKNSARISRKKPVVNKKSPKKAVKGGRRKKMA